MKNKIQTPEEKKEYQLWYARSRSKFVPEPTYYYNIGDIVSIGSLDDAVIVDILDNGKLYEIDYTATDNNYGNPIIKHHSRNYWHWYEIRPVVKINHNLIKNDDMRLGYSQRQLQSIFTNVYSFGTNLDPIYQRGYVWELEDKINLIDSIFNNVDIGKFVFSHEEYNEGFLYEIVDGKQRINAICEYYENKFSYKELFFNDLNSLERHYFLGYSISWAEMSDMTQEQKLRYFVRLNKFGKVMDKGHLRKIEEMLND